MSNNYVSNPNKAVIEMPLGIYLVERQYTPQRSANEAAYQLDLAYFKSRKARFLAIRRAAVGEYDSLEATFFLDGQLIQPPAPWVRVTRHPTLGFSVVMVWRGALPTLRVDVNGYVETESDDAVQLILHSMTVQGCCSWPEVSDYLAKLERAKAIHNAQHGSGTDGKVH